MNIQPIKSDVPAVPVKARTTSAAADPAPTDVQTDSSSVERKQQLVDKLKDLPDARPEEAARAAEIVADTTYPSHELMSRLARLITGAK